MSLPSILDPVKPRFIIVVFYLSRLKNFRISSTILLMCNLLERGNPRNSYKIKMDGPRTRKPGPIESIDPDIESEKKTQVKGTKRKV